MRERPARRRWPVSCPLESRRAPVASLAVTVVNDVVQEEQSDSEPPEETNSADAAELSDESQELEDDDSLETYTSAEFSYSVSYPSSWTVDESDPASVHFYIEPFDGRMAMEVFEADGQSDEQFVEGVHKHWESVFSDYKVLDQQTVDLPDDQTAILVDNTYTETGTEMREKLLVAVADYAYAVSIAHTSDSYTDEFDETATDIVTSLIIK